VGMLLQIDARLNSGCSGGALVNLQGELIGLTTAQAAISGSETPGGFALPLDAPLKGVVEQLRSGKEVEYGFLGVQQQANPGAQGGRGLVLAMVPPGSPADRAGLHAGDRIVKINGRPVNDFDDLVLQVGIALAGSDVHIEYQRGGVGPTLHTSAHLAKFYVE